MSYPRFYIDDEPVSPERWAEYVLKEFDGPDELDEFCPGLWVLAQGINRAEGGRRQNGASTFRGRPCLCPPCDRAAESGSDFCYGCGLRDCTEHRASCGERAGRTAP